MFLLCSESSYICKDPEHLGPTCNNTIAHLTVARTPVRTRIRAIYQLLQKYPGLDVYDYDCMLLLVRRRKQEGSPKSRRLLLV